MSFFKGQLRMCSGDVYDDIISQNSLLMNELQNPVPWSQMDSGEQSLFSPLTISMNPINSSSFTCIATSGAEWPNAPCCVSPEFSESMLTSTTDTITSRMLCKVMINKCFL